MLGPEEGASPVSPVAAATTGVASGTGAAAAGGRAQDSLAAQLLPDVFSYSASDQWGGQGPCAPLCPQGVFSQDPFLGSTTLSSAHEHAFSGGSASASMWGSERVWDSNSFGNVEPLL